MSDNYDTSDDTSVKVAVRIRPQNSREIIDMCRICTSVESVEPQVILGADKAFTFDFVFDMNSNQNDIYNRCLENLVDGALNGYNATVLAYGQTGSGKTYTMGTGFERDICDEQIGIIPRAVYNLFSGIDNMKEQSKETMEFSLAIQFVELYNEEIIDLLDPYQKGKQYRIHEDLSGQITIADITVKSIYTPQDALKYLRQGALARSTASTQMNDQSSRSHALFTILIIRKQTESTQDSFIKDDIETFTSKFHFVDLAGSERLKRTGATGERAREGISINCGLLSLGNCISALGDKSKKSTHIPYRDSKLTRLLQDSLGGNSRTLMIACVSPSDRDFMETLNTLKYANRAKNIKNKVKLNQDKNSRTISQLRTEITTLQLELLEFKQGKRFVNHDGVSSHSDAFHENNMLIAENKRLQCRIKAMQETINMMSDANAKLKTERDVFKYYQEGHDFANVTDIISGYIKEIEVLQAKLRESEEMHKYLKQKTNFAYGDPSNTVVKYQSESLFLENDEQNSNPNNFTSANMPYLYEDSDGDSDDQNLSIHGDLYDINSDIEMKSKLLEQLETSQKRILLIRRHYEEKMSILQSTILNTQKERDEILSVIKKSNADEPSSQLKKIRGEYECKLNTLQNEVKKLQHGEREYIKQLRHAKTQEIKLRNLRNEINELKCIKARLARKISDQFKTHKNSEIKQSREILQLRKQHRKQENAVKTLQSQIMAKEQILKRKTEEVNALRKNQKCQKTSAQVIKKESKTYNSMIARQKLEKFRRGIARAARSKHVIQQLDRELDRLIAERDSLNFDLQNIRPCEKNDIFEMSNEEDTIKLSLNYVQENITYVQQSIIEIEDGKDSYSNETQFLHELISSIENMDEAKYLLKWLLDDAIVNKCNTIFSENLLTDQKTILNQMVQENLIQQQLIQHFLSQNNSMDICSIFDSINFKLSSISLNKLFQSQLSVNSNETYDIPFTDKLKSDLTEMHESIRGISPVQNSELVSKIRTRTAHAEDLLFGGHTSQKDGMTQSFQQDTLPNIGFPLTRVTSAPSALK